MWINRDVDLPQALVAGTTRRPPRHLRGRTGAGVSNGPPANLPSFEDLAVQIAGGALPNVEALPQSVAEWRRWLG